MPFISIIVPIYNVREYIEKCFASLAKQIKQEMKGEMEIICVDDGSTDGSGDICDFYARSYDEFKVIHQQNRGVGAARNRGLELARGEYLAWVDPDDYVAEDWYDNIKKALVDYTPDILVFDYCVDDGNSKSEKKYALIDGYIQKDKFLYDIVEDVKIQSQLWHKVFKRELFAGIKFPENIRCLEDYAVLHKLIFKAANIRYLHKCLYFYRLRRDGLVMTIDLKKSYDCYIVSRQRYAEMSSLCYNMSLLGYLLQALGLCIQYSQSPIHMQKQYKAAYVECVECIRGKIFYILSSKNCCLKLKLKFILCGAGLLPVVLTVRSMIRHR